MKHILLMLVAAAALAVGSGCRQKDMRTMTVALSGVSAEADVQTVSNTLSKLDGVVGESIVFHGMGSVTVRYDSMKLARKNIEYAVAKAGFGANDIPAKRTPTDADSAGRP